MNTALGPVRPAAPRRALILIAISQLLALTLWFSASAVGPQLEEVWGLTMGQTAGLTLAVQVGFVVGAIGSAVFGLADAWASRRLFVVSAMVGSAANAALVALGPGDHLLAFVLRLLTGVGLVGPAFGPIAPAGRWWPADRWWCRELVRLSLPFSGRPALVVIPVFLVWGFSVVADSAQFSAMSRKPRTMPSGELL